MKRMLTLSMAFVLCLLCLLLGSGAWAESEAVLYGETIISPPGGLDSIAAMALTPEGSMVAAAKDASGQWSLLTWTDAGGQPAVTPLAYEGADISSISVAPDGQIAALLAMSLGGLRGGSMSGNTNSSGIGQPVQTISSPTDVRSTVVWFDAAGQTVTTVELPELVSDIAALSGHRLAALGMSAGVTIYDETGNVVQSPGEQGAQDVTASGETVYALTAEAVVEFDARIGAKAREFPVTAGNGGEVTVGLDGMIYVKGADGLYRIDPNAPEPVKIMNLAVTLMGDPNMSLAGYGVFADGSIAVLVKAGLSGISFGGGGGTVRSAINAVIGGEDAESTLAIYRPTGATRTEASTLTITALYDSVALRKAVSVFQRQHPEIQVELTIQAPDGDTTPTADHIRTLNTKLLAGQGGDVLILDGLPLHHYIEKGILADLTQLADALNLLPGIREGSAAADGRVYAIPAEFSFDTVWGRKESLEGVRTLEDLANAPLAEGQTPFSARSAEEWIRLFYPAAESYLRDDAGALHYNTPEFEAFLETLYALYSTQGELPELQLPGRGNIGAAVNRAGVNPAEMLSLYNGASAFCPSKISGLMQLGTIYSLAGGADGAFITMPGTTGPATTYTPKTLAGVNARSGNQALAQEFLKVLFSDEVQGADQMGGLPTTQAALDRIFADQIEQSKDAKTMRFSIMGSVSMEIAPLTEETWNSLRSLCDTLNTPVAIDETLIGFLVEETADFFEGRESAADAAQALEQRAWYYLNE